MPSSAARPATPWPTSTAVTGQDPRASLARASDRASSEALRMSPSRCSMKRQDACHVRLLDDLGLLAQETGELARRGGRVVLALE